MSITTGFLKYKRYIKLSNGNYQLISHWTSSDTVQMSGSGNTLSTDLGSIRGITDSLTSTSSNIALSAKSGKSLQDQITTVNSNLDDSISSVLWAVGNQQINTTDKEDWKLVKNIFKGRGADHNDINQLTQNGIYSTTENCINGAISGWSVVLVFSPHGAAGLDGYNMIYQLQIQTYGSGIYLRKSSGNSWNNWVTLHS